MLERPCGLNVVVQSAFIPQENQLHWRVLIDVLSVQLCLFELLIRYEVSVASNSEIRSTDKKASTDLTVEESLKISRR